MSLVVTRQQFPPWVSTIEENSIKGNIALLRNIYINQLRLKEDDFPDLAIPRINSQTTNARIRGTKAARTGDANSFARTQCFQPEPGLFHMLMNLLWALLHIHRRYINSTGSLACWFSVLDRKPFSSSQPDFYTLRISLFQILDRLLLTCWNVELNNAGTRASPNFLRHSRLRMISMRLRPISSACTKS